jgi:hypothetical protein
MRSHALEVTKHIFLKRREQVVHLLDALSSDLSRLVQANQLGQQSTSEDATQRLVLRNHSALALLDEKAGTCLATRT